MNPLVSVVIPCYNGGHYVEDAVRSIMDQSWTNLEIIVIDDFSTDTTLGILKRLYSEDSRIKIIENDANLGLVATLNKGLNIARGAYIARMDADDIAMPQRIEKQVVFLETNKEVALCGCNYIKIDSNGNKIGKIKFPEYHKYLKAELLFFCPFAHPGVVMRKCALDQTGFYTEGMVPSEDYELWIRFAEKFKMANLPQYLLYYRWHKKNITITKKSLQAEAKLKVVNKHLQSFGFAEEYLGYHLKFLTGTWYHQSSVDEIRGFTGWEKALLKKNADHRLFDAHTLKITFNKYASLAFLSILKSKANNFRIKKAAFWKLLGIDPFITLRHILNRGIKRKNEFSG